MLPIIYKDVLGKLKQAGYSTYRIEKEKLIRSGTITRIRNGESISMNTLGILCKLIDCQPNELIEYVKDGEE